WFDRWFCSPSNHRVHHAVNDRYLDKNYGGILIVWDRMFGSFREEDEKCVYGTRSPLNSWDPLWANAEVYWALGKESWQAKNWGDKLRVWFKPPGWRPADLAARFPKENFDLTRVERFHPPLQPAVELFGGLQFLLLLAGVAYFLWHADALAAGPALVWLAALGTGLWAVGGLLQGRLSVLQVLLIEVAVLATATAALGWVEAHRLFKPLALLLAIVLVAARTRKQRAGGRFDHLLLAALVFSLAGDCLLMFPGFFIPGLVAFLVAHLFYIALFRRGVPWFASRRALMGTLVIGAVMYAFLFNGLNPVLRVAVAAYVVVIALMAAQAIGRASVLRDRAAVGVAVGAGFFMLSDALLATNKFAQPLPMAQLWVLSTYYIAQILIVFNAKPAAARQRVG
ncbi:MAG: lysoplasmalogenase family protein, partial [Polaromonas sp.]|nr:lysoplasmalogenase family protein [Polaromonas sp.]